MDLRELLSIAEDDRKQIVEIMRQPASQLAHSFHLVCLTQLLFQSIEFRHIGGAADNPAGLSFGIMQDHGAFDHVDNFAIGANKTEFAQPCPMAVCDGCSQAFDHPLAVVGVDPLLAGVRICHEIARVVAVPVAQLFVPPDRAFGKVNVADKIIGGEAEQAEAFLAHAERSGAPFSLFGKRSAPDLLIAVFREQTDEGHESKVADRVGQDGGNADCVCQIGHHEHDHGRRTDVYQNPDPAFVKAKIGEVVEHNQRKEPGHVRQGAGRLIGGGVGDDRPCIEVHAVVDGEASRDHTGRHRWPDRHCDQQAAGYDGRNAQHPRLCPGYVA